jgi:CRP-like cAMP-binding protein
MSLSSRRERAQRIEALRALPLVAGCSRRQLERIDLLGTEVSVRPGEALTHQGTLGRECFLILGGEAAAQRDDLTIGSVLTGTIAGELALIDGIDRSATVVANTAMRLVVLTPREFSELLDAAPCVQDRVHAIAAQRRAALDVAGAR